MTEEARKAILAVIRAARRLPFRGAPEEEDEEVEAEAGDISRVPTEPARAEIEAGPVVTQAPPEESPRSGVQ